MPAPPQIEVLVSSFEEHKAEYMNRTYEETTTRTRFINPLFEELGWDVRNLRQLPQTDCEVYFEDRIRREDVRDDAISTIVGKKPDYSFRINKRRMFYVEAKKPSEDLARNKAHAYQVRAYGWNANLPVSVLTDFQEFYVYDCRIPPAVGDDPRTGLVPAMSFTYEQYLDEWDRIAKLLSRDSVVAGSLDTFREAVKPSRGAQTVDAAFLHDISLWREALARDINRRNPKLSQDDLNYAVQMTINRIIFLRICEDRGIERPETLKGALARSRVGEIGEAAQVLKGTVYPALVRMFRQADQVYNSGLFHFNKNDVLAEHSDEFTPNLDVGDDVLADIVNHLYYPYPYKFDVIPVEILGQVYEQFLGKVIVKQPGGDVNVDYKPEVRKAGGVYYTPTYIVDYIVEHTVGKLVEGKTPEQVSELRVLDPACGSGSFLVGAYQYLLDWHLRYYTRDPQLAERLAKGKNKRLDKLPSHAGDMQQGTPGYRLTITERKRILRNNIYGVDIDPQAVEVTKLSLLLKVVEGEQERQEQLRLDLEARERLLPDLGHNIKSGNSLIGPDFYTGTQLGMFDEAETRRVNAFDWQQEFPEVMGRGGFDAVIGNPPYVRMEQFTTIKEYLRKHYTAHDERTDLYVYFIEKSIQLLVSSGYYGVIVSNKWIRSLYGSKIRRVVAEQTRILNLIDFGELPVFQDAATMPLILIVRKEPSAGTYHFSYVPSFPRELFGGVTRSGVELAHVESRLTVSVSSLQLAGSSWRLGALSTDNLLDKLQLRSSTLEEYTEGQILYGIKTGLVRAFVIDQATRDMLVQESPRAASVIKPYIIGDDVRKYHIRTRDRYLIYTYHGISMDGCGSILRYLTQFRTELENRATKQEWYELQQPQQRYAPHYEAPKIIYPDIAKESRFAFDVTGAYPADTTFVIPTRDMYLLGILNSRMSFFYFSLVCPVLGDARQGGRLRLKLNYVKQLPIRTIDFSNPTDKAHHDRMVQLVDRMLALHKALASTNNPITKERYQRDIETTDRAIDDLVYDLYALTEEERKIVEGTA